ncbi:MAG: hypothetical protein AB8H12_06975 [Lewinella sp.]
MKTIFISLGLLFAVTAFGQDHGNSIERHGFVIGFGIGGGVISIADSGDETPFDEAQAGISLPNLKFGWMVSNRLALLATFPGMIYEFEGKDRSFDAFIPSVQYWMSDRWWIDAGVGLAMDFPAFYEVDDFRDEDWNFGGAVSFSTGIELVQQKKYTLDLQTRLHMGRVYLDNDAHRDGVAFTVGIGFNWY